MKIEELQRIYKWSREHPTSAKLICTTWDHIFLPYDTVDYLLGKQPVHYKCIRCDKDDYRFELRSNADFDFNGKVINFL